MYAVGMPYVWSDAHRLHVPHSEVWVGVPIAPLEVPARVDVIRAALDDAGARRAGATVHGRASLELVHDAEFLDYLETAHSRWLSSGYVDDPGQDQVVPYVFPTFRSFGGIEPLMPVAESARAGWYAMDTTTPIGSGSFDAAVAAADCALTAADLVLSGEPATYALCRPPGHHAGRDFFGGSCYLNNAAVAAEHMRCGGVGRVGIVDLDAHHGNGTQALFYQRSDVVYTSVHIDPDAGWFPHFVGRADEKGVGSGRGANHNEPLPEDAGDDGWLGAVDRLCDSLVGCEALVVSLGVDGHADDPESPLRVTAAGYREACRRIGTLRLPTVLVQEGGYRLETLGDLVAGSLAGFENGRAQ